MLKNGYSLPELLAVLTVLSIISIVALFSLRSFRQDQDLRVAAESIQSQIRSVQANATTNLKCSNQSSKIWQVSFTKNNNNNGYEVKTKCQYLSSGPNPAIITVYTNNITKAVSIDKFKRLENPNQSCEFNIEPASSQVLISFSPVSGKVTYSSTTESLNCPVSSWQKMEIVLKTGEDFKSVIVDKGGLIFVK